MKNGLMLLGVAVAGIGAYLYFTKKDDCGCDKKKSPDVVPAAKKGVVLYADEALEQFNTQWHELFPTPKGRLGQGPLSIDNATTFSAQNFVND